MFAEGGRRGRFGKSILRRHHGGTGSRKPQGDPAGRDPIAAAQSLSSIGCRSGGGRPVTSEVYESGNRRAEIDDHVVSFLRVTGHIRRSLQAVWWMEEPDIKRAR